MVDDIDHPDENRFAKQVPKQVKNENWKNM